MTRIESHSSGVTDEALLQHVVIVGRTNSGKTFAAKSLAERILDSGRRLCVLDPTDVWWGLRSNAAGDGPGYPVVVFGGDHGDLPIAESSALPLARLIAEGNVPAVISLADFSMGERHRFAAAFLQELHKLNRSPLHLVIDEADELAPQNPMAEAKFSLHQVDRIVRRGRVRGFRTTLISQRPAVLHKNVLTQANVLIAMRLPAPQDRKAIEAWITGQADIDEGRAVLASLSSLPRGTGWVWAPEAGGLGKFTFPPIRTFDSSRSPGDGETIDAPKSLAEVDLAAIRNALRFEPPKPAATSGETSKEIIDAVRQEGYVEGLTDGRAESDRRIDELLALLTAVSGKAHEIEGMITGYFYPPERGTAPPPPEPPQRASPVATHSPAAAPPREPQREGRPSKPQTRNGAELRILRVLAQQHPKRLTQQQWAALSGMSRRGGTWGTYVSRLRTAGYLDDIGTSVQVTSAGRDAAGDVPPQPSSPIEVRAMWRQALGSGPGKLMDILNQHGALKRDALAAEAGMSPGGGTFGTYLSRLRSNGLVLVDRSRIQLADELRG